MVNLSGPPTKEGINAMRLAQTQTKPTTARRRKSPLPTEGAAVPIPRKVTDWHYKIDSFSQTLVTYDLRNYYGYWECNCPQYVFTHDCKHTKSLAYWLQEQALVTAVSASYARYTAETEVTLESLFASPPSPQEVQEARREVMARRTVGRR